MADSYYPPLSWLAAYSVGKGFVLLHELCSDGSMAYYCRAKLVPLSTTGSLVVDTYHYVPIYGGKYLLRYDGIVFSEIQGKRDADDGIRFSATAVYDRCELAIVKHSSFLAGRFVDVPLNICSACLRTTELDGCLAVGCDDGIPPSVGSLRGVFHHSLHCLSLPD